MDEKHKKRGRRSHLNDFHLNVAGEYVYDGSLFACRSSEESLRGSKRVLSWYQQFYDAKDIIDLDVRPDLGVRWDQ